MIDDVGGLHTFHIETGKWQLLLTLPYLFPFMDTNYLLDNDNVLWIINNKKLVLYAYHIKSQKLTAYPLSLPAEPRHPFFLLDKNKLWILKENWLIAFDRIQRKAEDAGLTFISYVQKTIRYVW